MVQQLVHLVVELFKLAVIFVIFWIVITLLFFVFLYDLLLSLYNLL